MRNHRRTILRMLLLLVAGAMVNVAVAWGCVLLTWDKESDEFLSVMRSDHRVIISRWTGRLALAWETGFPYWLRHPEPMSETSFQNMVPCGSAFVTTDPQFDPHTFAYGEHAAGWPVLALLGKHDVRMKSQTITATGRGWFELPWSTTGNGKRPKLPWMPVWPGFAINTLFYAAVLWMIFFAPFALRRMIRRRHGRCPACAYPVGGSPVCTECGAAVVYPPAVPRAVG